MACAAAFVCFGGAATALGDNFHTVARGEIYRSAQPSAEDLSRWRRTHGIRTVINLRGEHPEEAWYRAEEAEARRLGVTLVNFCMSARQVLTGPEAWRLIEIMRRAERSILVHCRSGSDRTGLALALYLAAVRGSDEAAAERQLSIRYGHVGGPLSQTRAMDESFEAMEPALGFPDS